MEFSQITQVRQAYIERTIMPGTPEHIEIMNHVGLDKRERKSSFIRRIIVRPPCDRCQNKPAESFLSQGENGFDDICFQLCPSCLDLLTKIEDVGEEFDAIIQRWITQTQIMDNTPNLLAENTNASDDN